jgi:hypothetical protein
MFSLIAKYTPAFRGIYIPHFSLPQSLPERVKQTIFVFEKSIPLLALYDKWLDKLTYMVPVARLCAVPFLKGGVGEKVWLGFRSVAELCGRYFVGRHGTGQYLEVGKELPLQVHADLNMLESIKNLFSDPKQDALTKAGRYLGLLNGAAYFYGVHRKNYLPSILVDLGFNGVQIALAARASKGQNLLVWIDIGFKTAIVVVRFFQAWSEYIRNHWKNPPVEILGETLRKTRIPITAVVTTMEGTFNLEKISLLTINEQEYLQGISPDRPSLSYYLPTYEIINITII